MPTSRGLFSSVPVLNSKWLNCSQFSVFACRLSLHSAAAAQRRQNIFVNILPTSADTPTTQSPINNIQTVLACTSTSRRNMYIRGGKGKRRETRRGYFGRVLARRSSSRSCHIIHRRSLWWWYNMDGWMDMGAAPLRIGTPLSLLVCGLCSGVFAAIPSLLYAVSMMNVYLVLLLLHTVIMCTTGGGIFATAVSTSSIGYTRYQQTRQQTRPAAASRSSTKIVLI